MRLTFPNWTPNIWSHLPLKPSLTAGYGSSLGVLAPVGVDNFDRDPARNRAMDSERQKPDLSPA